MLIAGVKGRHSDVDDSEATNCPMPTARFDEDAGERLERHNVPVEFHVSFTFEDKVNLSNLLVKVQTAVSRNVDHVDRCDRVVSGHKSATCLATRARHGRNFIELGNAVAGRGDFTRVVHGLLAFEREERLCVQPKYLLILAG